MATPTDKIARSNAFKAELRKMLDNDDFVITQGDIFTEIPAVFKGKRAVAVGEHKTVKVTIVAGCPNDGKMYGE